MEIRIENTLNLEEIEYFRKKFNEFFKTDFNIIFDGTYVYFRDTE